ncbi:MAG: RNase J family beta-CASP ribonuclease [Oscillospiraceae bacterium]|nr:RNase J family beta-CASP ribonuclease [Oscillospiraceae bacterium]
MSTDKNDGQYRLFDRIRVDDAETKREPESAEKPKRRRQPRGKKAPSPAQTPDRKESAPAAKAPREKTPAAKAPAGKGTVRKEKTGAGKRMPAAPHRKKAGAAADKPVRETKKTARPRRRADSAQSGETQKITVRDDALRIIPLGGLGEVGKNMTMYECGGDAFIVDCGLMFPDDELFGVDIVIPDFTYAVMRKDHIRGMIITHAHEDHIGGIPYFLREMDIPIYGSKLTIGIIKSKLEEFGLANSAKLRTIEIGDTVTFGCMQVETVRVNHSIPGAMAVAIRTPFGTVVQTGDFKVDYTPVFDKTIDLVRFGQLGAEGVLALLADSTNVERPGNSMTESNVGNALESLFSRAEGKRLIIASFASNIQRVQQIIDLAKRHGRKIALSGRSMINYTQIARELGYLTLEDDMLVDIDDIRRYKPNDLIIITTGSQGEPMSALSRMSAGTHKQVTIGKDDMIIISATPIPGNEKSVTRIINELLKLGSDVIYESMYETHASGHACQDELKLMMQLTKPKYFVPVHGEYKHLVKHANLAKSLGIPEKNVIIPEIGRVIEFTKDGVSTAQTVPSGRVLVDGLGVGDVGSVVLRDRKHLSQDGLLVVVASVDLETGEIISGPDMISRGFVFVKESDQLMTDARKLVRGILENYVASDKKGRGDVKMKIREELSRMMFQRTKRSPMILPVIMEI